MMEPPAGPGAPGFTGTMLICLASLGLSFVAIGVGYEFFDLLVTAMDTRGGVETSTAAGLALLAVAMAVLSLLIYRLGISTDLLPLQEKYMHSVWGVRPEAVRNRYWKPLVASAIPMLFVVGALLRSTLLNLSSMLLFILMYILLFVEMGFMVLWVLEMEKVPRKEG